ncbi:hypothetical protein DPEC_G00288270 [Dallia pectoralis]|uniref:Uncharacterized protein n=1 Tax=Dallia pectoralis TaxID=75939 RepID=A0ACC2FKP3_DALPE|nr:hypothetical protein DPEC_G00288270 [Dallia pectoralis]
MATSASPLSFSPSSGFTFSAPVVKTAPSVSNGRTASPKSAAVKHAASESIEEFEGPFKPAKVLKQGSVLDLLKEPGFATPVTRTSPVPKAPQDTPAPPPFSAPPLRDLFKAPVGSWYCDVCMLQNKPTDSTCSACTAPRPNIDSSKTSSTPFTTSSMLNNTTTPSTTTSSSFGSMFAKPAGTWDCDTCLVPNKPEAVKCLACETAKPGTGMKATLTLTTSSSEAKTPLSVVPLLGFGAKFKKPEDAWECDVCLVQNQAPSDKCVACMSAKPGAGAPPQSLPPSSTSTTTLLGFGDKFKKPEGAWDCDVCCVQNRGSDQQCAACQTPKPGAKVEPKAFGSTSLAAQSSSGNSSGGFKFGTGASSDSSSSCGGGGFKFGGSLSESASSGGFKFGVAASSESSTDNGGSGGFKFSSSSEGFKFGSSAATPPAADRGEKADAPSMGAGFKFGIAGGIAFGSASVETKPSEGGFSFGLSKPEEKSTPATSTFGIPASTENHTGAFSGPITGTTATTAAAPTFGKLTAAPTFGKVTEATPPALATPMGGSIFGETTEKDPAKPAAAFTFGKPEETSSLVGSGFLFAPASKEQEVSSASMGFSFGKPEPPKDQLKAPSFAFGELSDKSGTPPANAPKPSFSFGQSTADVVAPKPAFGFMASTASTPSSTPSSAPAPSMFGDPGSSSPAQSTFLFGQSSSGEATPTKTFLFGQSQDGQPGQTASLNASVASTQPFQFGSGTNNISGSFPFVASASSAAPASAAAAPSMFLFSPAASAGFGPGQAPAFGQGASQPGVPAFSSPTLSPFSAPASQPPSFGAKPNSVPVFGQQANSTPSFGSSAPSAPGGGFQFGGASVFGASSNSTGVFAFGGAPGGSPVPSVTPSMAPQTSAPGGAFNFAAPPTFNIGSAKSTNFTAPPAVSHSIAGRKIKTAVRRKK